MYEFMTLGTSKVMERITVLHTELDTFNNDASGFSILIEAERRKILFDVSYSDDIIGNAKRMNVSLDDIDYIVLSHGHWDHTDGLKNLGRTKVLCHPQCFIDRHRRNGFYVGIHSSLKDLEKRFEMILSKGPYEISSDIIFLGEIPRTNDFERKESNWYYLQDGKKNEDYVLDDSALAIKTAKGLIVVAGCSHAGICNIIEYAKKVCNEKKVYAVIGGFHLFSEEKTRKTVEYLKKEGIKKMYVGHCIDDYAFSELAKNGARKLRTSQKIILR